MKSQFSMDLSLRARTLSSMKMKVCSSVMALAMGLSTNAGAAEDWQEMSIEIGAAKHSFSERCVNIDAQQKVQYRFQSPHPTDFNIHYHTGEKTSFKRKEKRVAELEGEFESDAQQEFCFMWTNKERREADLNFTLHYKVSLLP